MNRKSPMKIVIDIMMAVMMLALMSYWLIGEQIHEWLGVAIFVLFLLHHIVNRNWIRSLPKGKWGPLRIFQTTINAATMTAMLLQIGSGVLLSRYVFHSLHPPINLMTIRTVHHTDAYWLFVLTAVHFGTHWMMIQNVIKRVRKKSEQPTSYKALSRILAVLITTYGIFALMKRNLLSYLFLFQQFTFFDDRELLILFFIDYFAIFCLFSIVGHFAVKVLKSKPLKNDNPKEGYE